jgi:TonB family protein
MRFISSVSPIIVILAMAATVSSQSVASGSPRDRGIALVKENNATEAINLLTEVVKQYKKDVRAWHWLGMAFEKQNMLADSINAHQNAAKSAEEIQTKARDYLSKTALLEAAESAERFLALKPSLSDKQRKEWRNRADFLRLGAASTESGEKIYKSGEVTTKVRVIKKPQPSYSGQATGTVVLRCVFSADGRIRHISVVRGLPDGLTERAIEAAKQIKFIPAMKDGKPVSMWMQLEYNFLFGY